jgi:prepilin-type N-terminal cleavage/methylation domain-containing protein
MIRFKKQCKEAANTFCKTLRPAFTLIEILIAVSILSVAFVYVLKVHSDNAKYIIYLSERNKHSLEDSLFLSKNILRYHKDNKTAYDILERYVKIKEDESRTILKKTHRDIFIPEEIKIIPPPETRGPTAIVNEIKIKDKHSANYWHFKIQSF